MIRGLFTYPWTLPIQGANQAPPYHFLHILSRVFLPLPAYLTPAITTFLQADTLRIFSILFRLVLSLIFHSKLYENIVPGSLGFSWWSHSLELKFISRCRFGRCMERGVAFVLIWAIDRPSEIFASTTLERNSWAVPMTDIANCGTRRLVCYTRSFILPVMLQC